MEKKCDCECHKLAELPCVYCASRHAEPELLDEEHDGLTEPANQWPPLDDEGFPF